MATITAQAKLYTGIRCWCVDKNISAALTSSFSIGNKDIDFPTDVPVLDANGRDTIYPGVYIWRLRRAVADLLCPRPQPALVDERYKTYGGGNNVITAGTPRQVDNTNNWKVNATVSCTFPTYIEIDIEKLGIPEGTDCVLNFEEGWLLEDKGRKLPSGAWEYPNAVQGSLSPEALNYVTFRTPYYGLSFMNSTFTFPIGNFRLRRTDSAVGALFTPNFIAKANKAGVTEMESISNLYFVPGRTRYFASQMYGTFGPIGPGSVAWLEGNGYPYPTGLGSWPAGFPGVIRIRQDSAAIVYDSAATMNVEGYNLPWIWTYENFNSQTTMVSNVDAYKGVGTPALLSQTSLTASGKVDFNSTIPTMQSQTSIVCRPVINAKANIVASSSLSCNAISSSAMRLRIVVPSGNTHARTFGFNFTGNVLVSIDWGDGQVDNNVSTSGLKLKTYANPGTYYVAIDRIDESGSGIPLEGWRIQEAQSRIINGVSGTINPPGMVRECYGFGKLNTVNLDYTFSGCNNLTNVPSYLPPTVQTLNFTFNFCTSLNDSNISLWNTTNVTSMYGTFDTCQTFNRPLNGWNVSNVTNMQQLFDNCVVFNQDITGWNTSNVTNMAVMFYNCQAFNQNIGSWDVSKVTNFSSMFTNALVFNGNIENWTINTTNNVSMYQMFYAATSFNRPIGVWNTSKVSPGSVSGMTNMFGYASVFNQDLSGWCVSLITTKPTGFDTNTPAWVKTGRQPVWGTCP